MNWKSLDQLEAPIFAWVDKTLRSNLLDQLMLAASNKWLWFAVALAGFGVVGYRYGLYHLKTLVPAIMIAAFADYSTGAWLKPGFNRLRPCHTDAVTYRIDGCGGRYSFPSSHATNAAFAAVTLGFVLAKHRRWLFLLALVVGGIQESILADTTPATSSLG